MGLHALKVPSKDLYLLVERVKMGPHTIEEVFRMFEENRIDRATPLWYPGLLNWVTVGDIPNFNRRKSTDPPPIPARNVAPSVWIHFQEQVVSMPIVQIQELVDQRRFRRADYVYIAETNNWVRADQHPLLVHIFPPGVDTPDKG